MAVIPPKQMWKPMEISPVDFVGAMRSMMCPVCSAPLEVLEETKKFSFHEMGPVRRFSTLTIVCVKGHFQHADGKITDFRPATVQRSESWI